MITSPVVSANPVLSAAPLPRLSLAEMTALAIERLSALKVAEGKLRRLDDLLPRAGFDGKMLTMLYGHLRERVLICKGCLGRFPRKEGGSFAIECPRCDYNMLADALEPSDEVQLPEEQRQALLASSEAVLETISIADRQRARANRRSDQNQAAGDCHHVLL